MNKLEQIVRQIYMSPYDGHFENNLYNYQLCLYDGLHIDKLMYYAILSNDISIIQYIHDNGLNINYAHLLLAAKQYVICYRYISMNMDNSHIFELDGTTLAIAISNGNYELVRYLIVEKHVHAKIKWDICSGAESSDMLRFLIGLGVMPTEQTRHFYDVTMRHSLNMVLTKND